MDRLESPDPVRRDAAGLLYELATACSRCRTRAAFEGIVRTHVQGLLPHRSLLAVLGRLDLEHLEIVHMVAIDYPPAGLAALKPQINLRERPALMQWLRSGQPLVLDIAQDAPLMSPLERHEIEALDPGKVAAHGVIDMAARSGSYLSFAGVAPTASRTELASTLNLVVPHLHQALMAVYAAERASASPSLQLSHAERDLIQLVAAGRTNAEIAATRGTSEATVRNQLTSAFKKVGVRNRAEAVRRELAQVHIGVARVAPPCGRRSDDHSSQPEP